MGTSNQLNFDIRSQTKRVRGSDKLNMKLNRGKSKLSMKRNCVKNELNMRRNCVKNALNMKRNYDKSKPSTRHDRGNGHDRTHMKDRGVQDHLSSSNNRSHVHHSVRACSLSCDR